ncbi:ABATE domain-containing protein [Streptomyces sp. 8K308]|uniref:CGNR zinc finger domain-containing protein n=1 Tax=Streptomyces sp. 8K308 TaxID=2530388 RepID=UPI001FB79482|nr:ABATE domain-containing protein [Streptomyces sp. 8K308]
MEWDLVLGLVNTVRHDGHGGVADDLADVGGFGDWVAGCGVGVVVVDERLRGEVVALRRAVRALFARAVRPGPASSADAGRLMPEAEAVALLNERAARAPGVPQLEWSAEADAPRARFVAGEPEFGATLARAAIDFLAGPDLARLRACTAPRCVRYFLKGHGRQEWCKPSCGNRARAARHYQRRHGRSGTVRRAT